MENRSSMIYIILDKLRRNSLLSDIAPETVVDWTVEFMGIVGFPSFYDERVAKVKIKDYRGLLPPDCLEVLAVRGVIRYDEVEKPISYRYDTDTFSKSKNIRYKNDFTYRIQGSIIHTSLEEGELEIVYSAYLQDINGFPIIPENEKFFTALINYIKVKHFESLFEQGKLQYTVLDHAEREYYWSVGRCESEFHKISMDKAESIGNQWRQILINTNEHLSGYANLGVKKDLKIK